MAKRYINETGLKHLWSKSLNLFAQKNVLNEYAKQKDVDDVKQSLDSKADLVGGKIPESQIPDELKNNSSVAVQEVMAISAEFNFDTGQAQNFSHSYEEIVQAFNDGKVIKLVASYGSDDEPQHAIGDLIHFREDEKVLEFAVFVYSNILTSEHELHHFRVVMNNNNTAETTIEVLGNDSGNNNNSEEVAREIFWVNAVFNMQTMKFVNIDKSYNEIISTIDNNQVVKMNIILLGLNQTVYGDLFYNNLSGTNPNIGLSVLAVLDMGAGYQLYHFNIAMFPDNSTNLTVRLVNTTTM